jgi:hypothetical protein
LTEAATRYTAAFNLLAIPILKMLRAAFFVLAWALGPLTPVAETFAFLAIELHCVEEPIVLRLAVGDLVHGGVEEAVKHPFRIVSCGVIARSEYGCCPSNVRASHRSATHGGGASIAAMTRRDDAASGAEDIDAGPII